jgi:hypothetical protein
MLMADHIPIYSDNHWWDADRPTLDESLVAGCAAYRAFSRYLSGADLFLKPRNKRDLESVLYVLPSWTYNPFVADLLQPRRRRYAYDAIHNTIATARTTVQPGGYSRVRALVIIAFAAINADTVHHICSSAL